MPRSAPSLPALRGGMLALLAAALFGISTPLVQQFGVGLGAFSTAALLYAGAAAVGLLSRQRIEREARLQLNDMPRLLAMAGFGAVVGPVALAWGLQHTSGTSASLMLTLEALFTAVLAWRLYRETMDGRVWTAMALLLAGGMVLVLDQGRTGGAQLWGLLAVLLATAAWGVDNTLSRALAERDPGQVVMVKALLGATATALLAMLFGEPLPSAGAALALLAIGATGYGLSLRFYLLAQRAFGAARTGSVFAFAPFIGAAFAVALGDRSASGLMALGSGLMLAGVVLHLAESHGHEHEHEALGHEHAHRHDDGHHDHVHEPMPAGEHSFEFTKEKLQSLPLPAAGQRVTYQDTEADGLELRFSSSGVKTFSWFRRVKNGPPERVTLGRFPEMPIVKAGEEAAKLNAVRISGDTSCIPPPCAAGARAGWPRRWPSPS